MGCANLSNQGRNRTRKASYSFIRDKATLLFRELEFPSECPECPCGILHGLEQLLQQFFHVPGCLRSVWWWRETLFSPDAVRSEPRRGGNDLTMDPEVLLKAFSIHQEFWSFCIAVKLCQRTKSPHHYHTPHQFSHAAEKVRHLFPAPPLLLPESQGSLDYPLWLLVGKALVFSCTQQTTLTTLML